MIKKESKGGDATTVVKTGLGRTIQRLYGMLVELSRET
jgi:hypothetical protein